MRAAIDGWNMRGRMSKLHYEGCHWRMQYEGKDVQTSLWGLPLTDAIWGEGCPNFIMRAAIDGWNMRGRMSKLLSPFGPGWRGWINECIPVSLSPFKFSDQAEACRQWGTGGCHQDQVTWHARVHRLCWLDTQCHVSLIQTGTPSRKEFPSSLPTFQDLLHVVSDVDVKPVLCLCKDLIGQIAGCVRTLHQSTVQGKGVLLFACATNQFGFSGWSLFLPFSLKKKKTQHAAGQNAHAYMQETFNVHTHTHTHTHTHVSYETNQIMYDNKSSKADFNGANSMWVEKESAVSPAPRE